MAVAQDELDRARHVPEGVDGLVDDTKGARLAQPLLDDELLGSTDGPV